MNGYRLRSSQGDTIDPRQPLPVDTVEGQALVSKSETITYNGKAAAGAVTINATTIKPIVSMEGDQVASYWGNEQNRVYTAYIDTFAQTKGEKNWVLSLTETNGSADVVVYDPNKDLEELFESLTTTVKRFILKATDTDGATLYGWIFGVVDATDSYTFTIANNRLTETQNWVGTLASFDNTSIEKIEIFRYNTPVAYTTGTTLTEEVPCPREYSKNWENPLVYAEGLDDGQYFVDYMRGRIIGVKADNTASETITYSVWSALSSTSASSEVDITKVGGTAVAVDDSAMAATPPFVPVGGEYRNAATTYADGDATVLQTDVNGHLKCAIDSDIEIGAVEIKDGTTDARQAVKVDNATATATPTVAMVGAHYKATLDTYNDNDATPFHTDANGRLLVAEQNSASSALQALGTDAAGADAYATVLTSGAAATHIQVTLGGTNDAIVSVDAGTTDGIYIPAGSIITLDNVTIGATTAIQAKNATGGSNYASMTITIW